MARLRVRCIVSIQLRPCEDGVFRYVRIGGERSSDLTVGRMYEAEFDSDPDSLRVWDDSGEDYLYPKSMFEVLPDATETPECSVSGSSSQRTTSVISVDD